ncbi:MAG: polyamine aminopropyltransferase [Microcystaceae cyanobacterium]
MSYSLKHNQKRSLLMAAAVSSATGLAVELLLGTLASYLMGNQALAYGIAVGGFLAAMGIGSYLSRFIATNITGESLSHRLLTSFVAVELAIAPLTALLPLGLFALFVVGDTIWLQLFFVTIILGLLAGLEVPLLTRILEQGEGVKDALAGVLALDYLGALFGSLGFPILFLPLLGMFPTAFLLGSLPAFMVFVIGRQFPLVRRWGYGGLAIGVLLLTLAPFAVPLSNNLENNLYDAPVIERIQSKYQRIVLTRRGQEIRLFLNGDLQFSTLDEYRYHEALVHPAMSAVANPRQILLLGAGDGLAIREILKWPSVEQITLIELDPAIVKVASRYPQLRQLNQGALEASQVKIIYGDAFTEVSRLNQSFDVIIADFPDPDADVLAKLYAEGFYRRLMSRLAPNGIFVTQASSPFFSPKVISCITVTLDEAGLQTYPYSINVPSFGPWGFVIATRQSIVPTQLNLPIDTRFLTPNLLHSLFELPKDIAIDRSVEINRLSHPVIIRYQLETRKIINQSIQF